MICRTLVLLALFAVQLPSFGQGTESDRIDFFGDFRLRLEQDWDSLQGDGSGRDDRLRLRFRLRGGVELKFNGRWSGLVAARTGPKLSQQSPHITIHDFDGGPDGPYQANFDRWYVKYASGGFSAWAGRNELSAAHQDDMFVFDNITYAGAGFSYRRLFGSNGIEFNGNYVALPVGMRDFSGTAAFGQVAYLREIDDSRLAVAVGFFDTNADPDDPAGQVLLTENNTRDYLVFDLQLQYRWVARGQRFQVGLDYTHNAEDYDDAPPDSFSGFHKDHVDGYVAHLQWGEREDPGDWQFAYFFAHQEALALNSSYLQDDWVRWGNANQVRATNISGSEFRAAYTISSNMNIFARLFFVDAIDLLQPGDSSKETGNRLRIDWNVAF